MRPKNRWAGTMLSKWPISGRKSRIWAAESPENRWGARYAYWYTASPLEKMPTHTILRMP